MGEADSLGEFYLFNLCKIAKNREIKPFFILMPFRVRIDTAFAPFFLKPVH